MMSGIQIKMNNPDGTGIGNGVDRHTFTIITEDGTEYQFKNWAISTSGSDTTTSYVSSWFLTQIITVNNRKIDFIYDTTTTGAQKSYPIRTFVQNYLPPGALQNIASPQIDIDDIYLTKIQFSNGAVDFKYSDEGVREDIPLAHYLERVEITNLEQKITKRHNFNYSYFGTSNANIGTLETGDYGNQLNYNGNQNPHINLRLRLDSVVEDDIKVHSFTYYDQNVIPNKTSMSQDYWGFYNGISNTRSFIPNVPTSIALFTVPDAAERYPVESMAKLFSLKRITYPAKGASVFDYECNTYDPAPFANSAVNANNSPVSETDFYAGTGFPFDSTTAPLNTVQRSENAISFGGDNFVTKQIFPSTASAVNVKMDFAIYGSQVPADKRTNMGSDNPFDFGTDMVLRIRSNATGNTIIERGYNSEQASADFIATGRAFFSIDIDFPNFIVGNNGIAIDLPSLNDNAGYTLEAFFNDYDGLYFGQAKITAMWEETVEAGSSDNPSDFSLGGGLRIKSITDLDSNGRQARKRNFNYHFTETQFDGSVVEKSHGRIKITPDFQNNAPYTQDFSGNSVIIFASSSSQTPLSKHQGSYVGYGEVVMTYENTLTEDNGKTISRFYNFTDIVNRGNNIGFTYIDNYYRFQPIRIPHNGMLFQQQQFKRSGDNDYTLLTDTRSEYRINGINATSFRASDFFGTSDFIMGGKLEEMVLAEESAITISQDQINFRCRNTFFQFHPYYSSRVELGSSTSIQYDENGQNPLSTTQKTFYDNPIHYMPTRTETVDSEGNTITTQTWYPDDINTNANNLEGGPFTSSEISAINLFKASNSIDSLRRIGQPIQTLVVNNGEKSIQRSGFRNWGNGIILPRTNNTLKGELSIDNQLQERATIHQYDNFGNPLEVSGDQGPISSYIWGHNKTYVIAKIQNADYEKIRSALDFSSTSQIEDLNESDKALINGLRSNNAMSDTMIYTYTYDPLIGITSMTDPRGYTIYYEYDEFNRLKTVKDDNGFLLEDYEYNYKGQIQE